MNAGRIDEAIDIVRADTGLIYMQEIRNTLDEFQDVTDDRLRVIVNDQLQAADNLRWVTIGGAIAIIAVVGGALFLIAKYVGD